MGVGAEAEEPIGNAIDAAFEVVEGVPLKIAEGAPASPCRPAPGPKAPPIDRDGPNASLSGEM
jgi:hypothetical protein